MVAGRSGFIYIAFDKMLSHINNIKCIYKLYPDKVDIDDLYILSEMYQNGSIKQSDMLLIWLD